jgi:hypothetical protein
VRLSRALRGSPAIVIKLVHLRQRCEFARSVIRHYVRIQEQFKDALDKLVEEIHLGSGNERQWFLRVDVVQQVPPFYREHYTQLR